VNVQQRAFDGIQQHLGGSKAAGANRPIGLDRTVAAQVAGIVDAHGVQPLRGSLAEVLERLQFVVHTASSAACRWPPRISVVLPDRAAAAGRYRLLLMVGVGAVAQPGAEIHRHEDFVRTEFDREVGAGYLRMGDAGAFELRAAKVHAAQVGAAKVGVGEVDARGVDGAQIEAPEVAAAQVDGLALGPLLVEGGGALVRAFLATNLWQRFDIYQTDAVLGTGIKGVVGNQGPVATQTRVGNALHQVIYREAK